MASWIYYKMCQCCCCVFRNTWMQNDSSKKLTTWGRSGEAALLVCWWSLVASRRATSLTHPHSLSLQGSFLCHCWNKTTFRGCTLIGWIWNHELPQHQHVCSQDPLQTRSVHLKRIKDLQWFFSHTPLHVLVLSPPPPPSGDPVPDI